MTAPKNNPPRTTTTTQDRHGETVATRGNHVDHVEIAWHTWKSRGTRGNRVVHVTQLIRHPLKAFSLFAFLFSFSSLISRTRTIVPLRPNRARRTLSRRSLPRVPDGLHSRLSWSARHSLAGASTSLTSAVVCFSLPEVAQLVHAFPRLFPSCSVALLGCMLALDSRDRWPDISSISKTELH